MNDLTTPANEDIAWFIKDETDEAEDTYKSIRGPSYQNCGARNLMWS